MEKCSHPSFVKLVPGENSFVFKTPKVLSTGKYYLKLYTSLDYRANSKTFYIAAPIANKRLSLITPSPGSIYESRLLPFSYATSINGVFEIKSAFDQSIVSSIHISPGRVNLELSFKKTSIDFAAAQSFYVEIIGKRSRLSLWGRRVLYRGSDFVLDPRASLGSFLQLDSPVEPPYMRSTPPVSTKFPSTFFDGISTSTIGRDRMKSILVRREFLSAYYIESVLGAGRCGLVVRVNTKLGKRALKISTVERTCSRHFKQELAAFRLLEVNGVDPRYFISMSNHLGVNAGVNGRKVVRKFVFLDKFSTCSMLWKWIWFQE